ncbi:MAG TPA: hypothetical protein VFQ77_15485 [Pseudonocardiaceae bacterium]|nr:hypothetical protein [Pseudonocardiaceae bacterium]
MARTGGEPFRVVGQLQGSPLQLTVGSARAAAAVAACWREEGAETVDWFLRDDIAHPQPMFLITQAPDGTVHATDLTPGTPLSQHPTTRCGLPLTQTQVCSQVIGPSCAACRAVVTPPPVAVSDTFGPDQGGVSDP